MFSSKTLLMALAVVVGFAVTLAQAGPQGGGGCIFCEDFEGGSYVDGDVVGQLGVNGADWIKAPSLKDTPHRDDFGLGKGKVLGIRGTAWNETDARISLFADDAEVTSGKIRVSADLLFDAREVKVGLELHDGNGRRMLIGRTGPYCCVEPGQTLYARGGRMDSNSMAEEQSNYGKNVTSDTNTLRVNALVDLDTGESVFGWEILDGPLAGTSDPAAVTYSYAVDTYAGFFNPSFLVLDMWHNTESVDGNYAAFVGIDNIRVIDVAPEPASVMLLGVGGMLGMFRRNRR